MGNVSSHLSEKENFKRIIGQAWHESPGVEAHKDLWDRQWLLRPEGT